MGVSYRPKRVAFGLYYELWVAPSDFPTEPAVAAQRHVSNILPCGLNILWVASVYLRKTDNYLEVSGS